MFLRSADGRNEKGQFERGFGMIIKENIKKKITCAADIAKILQRILAAEHETDQDKEHFWVIGLNTRNKINYIELNSLGILDGCQIHPREVYRLAIMKACSSIIIAHNHPSGNLEPSTGDFLITETLRKASEIMGITLLDHILITKDNHYSFKGEGAFSCVPTNKKGGKNEN